MQKPVQSRMPVYGSKCAEMAGGRLLAGFVAILAVLTGPISAGADTLHPVSAMPNQRQHAEIVKNLQTIESGDLQKAGTMIDDARHPLARRLYKWLYYQSDADNKSVQAMQRFVRENQYFPGIKSMRLEIERNMRDDLDEDAVIAWYRDFSPLTSSGMRSYLAALEAHGKHDKLRRELAGWWRDALMRSADQRALLQHYDQYLSDKLHKRRITRLIYHNHFTNARRLAAHVGNGYARLVQARIDLRREAANVEAAIDAVPAHLLDDPGLRFDRLKWRRDHDLNDRAAQILNDPPSFEGMHVPQRWWHERHILVRRYIADKDYAGAYKLVRNHVQQNGLAFAQAEWLAGWLALRYLDQPRKGFFHFYDLYNKVRTPISRSRGAYWLGRAAEALDQRGVATAWYKQAAENAHSFYGQMARKALPAAQTPPWPDRVAGQGKAYSRIREDKRLVMARLLSEADMDWASEQMLRHVMEQIDKPGLYHALARYAEDIGLLHTSVRIAKAAARKGYYLDDYIYPVPDKNLMRMHGLEDPLVLALIRQESLFDPQAVSSAGAHGLMQLMPATARRIAARAGIGHDRSFLIRRPSHNVALGTRYLRQLLDRFNGSYVLALAAYNAGEHRVESWLDDYGDPRQAGINRIDWMESIPIYETRNYVQRVLEGVYGYRRALGTVNPHNPLNARRFQMVER